MGAERRQLTVMFCDLVGSTALAGRLDPEELRDVLHAYQDTCADAIQRFDGHIARYVGDGLLVYFGYPQAHEDDAQRAARAGLGIVAALPHLNARLQPTTGTPLQVRIGIHTGVVVAGEMGGGAYPDPLAIVGQTPNIAARLQELAQPDSVLVGAATYELIQGYFECRHLGAPALKGVSTPVAVYQVLSETTARSRLEVATAKGLTPLVGREEEVRLLLERWEQVKQGQGQVIWLSGESGIGKSRLVQVLKERIATEPQARIECGCSPYYQNSAFYPVIDLLQRRLAFAREDSLQKKLGKLEDLLAQSPIPLQEMVPPLAALLSLPVPDDRYPPLSLTPQRQREKTLEVGLAWLLGRAARLPVLCVVDDVHWSDPSTLELLTLLLAQIATARICVVLTCRPEFSPPWPAHPCLTHLALSRLTRPQAQLMVERIAGDQALSTAICEQLVVRADGIPLFVEELTKAVVESKEERRTTGGSPAPVAIPVTLHDSLMARLDRLGPVKAVAQLGATLGREFSYELLRAVAPIEEATLQSSLTRLGEAELVYQSGALPQAQYHFKHALIQEAAYHSLLKSTRQQYHRRIAQVLEEQFPDTQATQPELLAHHYTGADLKAQAIPYWQRAGEHAVARSAHLEAMGYLTRGLELLTSLPDTVERSRQELALQIALGGPLIATKGWSAQETGHAYTRARELCRQLGETPQLFSVLFGLWAFHLVRGEHHTARDLNTQLLSLARTLQDAALLLGAHWSAGCSAFFLGDFPSARTHLEQSLALYDPAQHRALAFLYGQDPAVSCRCFLALTLWPLGYADQALHQREDTLALARSLHHPFTLAWALAHVPVWPFLPQEAALRSALIEEGIALSTEHGFAHSLRALVVQRQCLRFAPTDGQAEIARLHAQLDTYRATGVDLHVPMLLGLIADACSTAGYTHEGLEAVGQALALLQHTGERQAESELYHLKGELLLQQLPVSPKSESLKVPNPQSAIRNPQLAAEACFHQAIDIARRQSAKALELRAVMSLSRLWQRQGKKAAAQQRLADTYQWFTEGWEMTDLQQAQALLEELA